MLAKLTSKNQLTLPKAVTDRLGPVQYFEVVLQAGQVLLTPVRIQRGDAVRAKLAELELDDQAVVAALDWAQAQDQTPPQPRRKSQPARQSVVAEKARKVESAGKTGKAAKVAKSTKVAKATPTRKAVARRSAAKA